MNETGIYRNPHSEYNLVSVVKKGKRVINTLQQYLIYSMDTNKYGRSISYKKQNKSAEYEHMDHKTVLEMGLRVGKGIQQKGLQNINDNRVDDND